MPSPPWPSCLASKLALFFSAVVGIAVFALPATARAQTQDVTVTIASAGIQRYSGGNAIENPNQASGLQYSITGSDCANDNSFQITYTASSPTGFIGTEFQAWAGSGCTTDANRAGITATCWPVSPPRAARSDQSSDTVTVRVRDILAQLVTTPKNIIYAAADASACNSPQSTSVAVSIIAINAAKSRGASTEISFPIRMLGPDKPTLDDVSGGENALNLKFTPPAGSVSAGTTSTDEAGTTTSNGAVEISRYILYCSPLKGGSAAPPANKGALKDDPSRCTPNANAFVGKAPSNDAGATAAGLVLADEDAGESTDAGADEAGVVDTEDAATGTDTDAGTTTTAPIRIDDSWRCDQFAGGASTEFRSTGYVLGQPYQVAIAAVDNFENVGAPSNVRCGIPVEIESFWEQYKGAGGLAGGGYCALEGVGLSTGAGAGGTALVALVLGVGLARRRKNS